MVASKDLVVVRKKGKPTQLSLLEIQDRLDARVQVAAIRPPVTSTRKAKVEQAKREFEVDPLDTMVGIQASATKLADIFDPTITPETVPLTQEQKNKLGEEFKALEELRIRIEAMQDRYRAIIFSHLDVVSPYIPGRPPSQVPGKVESEDYVFERRGGNRENPDLNTETLRDDLTPEQVALVYKTVHHPAVPEWDEPIFDEGEFGDLVNAGKIDLDVVAKHLTPGDWRTPAFYKTPVEGSK